MSRANGKSDSRSEPLKDGTSEVTKELFAMREDLIQGIAGHLLDGLVFGFNPQEASDENDYQFNAGLKEMIAGWNWDVGTGFGGDKVSISTIDTFSFQPQALGVPSPANFYDGYLQATQWTSTADVNKDFDVGLAGSSVPSSPDGAGAVGDVRDLTLPLWRLAETAEVVERELRPNIVRFLWGKAWNVPAVVSAVAERFEAFGPEGAPRRSWMRMRLLRVADPAPRPPASEGMESLPELAETHQVLGAGIAAGGEGPGPAIPPGERLDELADRYFGDPGAWKEIAELNDVDDPLHLAPGAALRIPIKEGP